MNASFSEIEAKIVGSTNVLVLCHKKPDIDTLGSALAFYNYLHSISKSVSLFCIDNPSEDFSFLPGIEKVCSNLNVFKSNFDLVLALDVGDKKMLGVSDEILLIIDESLLINIDHHFSNDNFGTLNYIDVNAASTTSIVYDFLDFVSFSIDPDTATLLLSGIYSDTGSFKHSNTNFKAFDLASKLMNLGGSVGDLSKILFNTKKTQSFKIWAKVFEKSFLSDSNVLISVIDEKDFKSTGTSIDDLSGVIEYLNMVPDVKYSMLLTSSEGALLKGSLRTKNSNIDLSKIAKKLGGGGHPGASGFSLKGKYQIENTLSIVSDDLSKKLLSF